jgi:hypothetical protein
MRPGYPIIAASIISLASSQAAVTLYAEYHLGESGSLGTNNNPQDSSGNGKNFGSEISGSTTNVSTTGVFAPGSTHYLDTSGSGNQGWYSTDLYSTGTTLPLDDFALGIFTRASENSAATRGDIFTTGGGFPNGAFKLSLSDNGWAASSHNIAWIGAANGISGSFTANEWVHLALIRSGGVTTFYIDGVAQSGTITSAPTHNSPHLSVDPGGTNYFDGHLDEARIVTFTTGESTTNILNALTAIPEPSSVLLGSLGMLTLLRRRR